MIFYFSGTGNSKHIAEKLSRMSGERFVFMSENTMVENETYEISEKESIGFIFPVYWYCIPTLVEKFIKQLKVSGYKKQYTYAIATYGIAAGNIMDRLREILNQKQIKLNGIFGVKMVDNYVIGYNIAKEEAQRETMRNAEEEIDRIISMIKNHTTKQYIKRGPIAFLTPITAFAYRKTDHTKKFYVTPACNGCGQCAKGCPCNAIHLKNEKPQWSGECTFCLKCLHNCKQKAVQYGKNTEKRNRYQYGRLS